ncbi:AAA family ATPase [Nocardia sp. NPDC004568]|uniref:helix-turn-helix transcriptional regulator n=1 Tax=Nocardia sp. NPDC004568 TaxID=3154551 RepID=UPI0033A8A598
MLHGREKEQEALAALVRQALAGRGGVAVVHGEPGIGKTALLDSVAAGATAARVLRATGVEPESDFGYATLHQLLLPVLDRIPELPSPQADALGAVFGLAAGPAPDRFLIGLATLSLLSELAGEQPVVCLVDDIHWADRPSINALEFVAKRIRTEPIALVLALRATEEPPLVPAGAFDVPLAALERTAARRLIEQTGRHLTPSQQDAVLDATAGNPLAIVELPVDAVPTGMTPSTPIPLADSLQGAFLARVRRYPQTAQRLLLLIAVAGQLSPELLGRAFGAAAVQELDGLGELVRTDSTTIVFRHSLIRSAVYHGATVGERREAHRALADAMGPAPGDAARRAWHLGQSVYGPDDEIAEQLGRAGRAARVNSATSAVLLARAGELSTRGPWRARRYLESAAAWWNGGDTDRAATMLALIDREESTDESVRRGIIWLRASMELHTGLPEDAVAMLSPLLPALTEAEPRQSIPMLMLFGEAGFHANLPAVWSEVSDIAERLPLSGDGPHDAMLRLFRGACRVRAGKPDGLVPGDRELVESLTDPAMLCWASGLLWGLGDRERGRRLNRAAVDAARRLGAAGILVWALERAVGDDIAAGRFRSAEISAAEGRRIADEIGHPNASCWHRGALALLAAVRGDEQRARDLAYAVLAEAVPRRLADVAITARRALGLIDLAAGRPAAALTNLRPPGEFVHPGVLPAYTPDLVEAAVRARRPELAAAAFEPLDAAAAASRAPELMASAARCRALLAASGAAEDEFRRALVLHEKCDLPFEYARTQLLFGEYLRRRRRRAQARVPLRAAFDIFRSLGAGAWTERARAELRAAGDRVEPSATTLRTDGLTPQEMRIVQAVVDGFTNREIAAQMFLSARTIDYHLRKIYTKLGVRSRADLIRVSLTGDLRHHLPAQR